MRLYRLHRTVEGGCSGGYEFFASKREAEKEARAYEKEDPDEKARVDEIEVTPTKDGILRMLNRYAVE